MTLWITQALHDELELTQEVNESISLKHQAQARQTGDNNILPTEDELLLQRIWSEFALTILSIHSRLHELNHKGDFKSWIDNAVQNDVIHQKQGDIILNIHRCLSTGNVRDLITGRWRDGLLRPVATENDYFIASASSGSASIDLHVLRIIVRAFANAQPCQLIQP